MADVPHCQVCAIELPAAIARMGVCVRCVMRANDPGPTIPTPRYASDRDDDA